MLDITARKDAESKAEAAEDRFRTLTERGPVVVYSFELIYDDSALTHSRMSYISPQVVELGYPAEHWFPESVWYEIMHPDDRERIARSVERNRWTGESWTLRYRLIRPDGTVIWLLDVGRMLERDMLGRPSTFQGILLDVTEDEDARARLETSERNQRQALEGMLAIPWSETIDPETGFERYTYIGPQVFDILGYTPEELMVESKHFPRMVHPDDRPRVREVLSRSDLSGIWEDTYRVLRRDGEIRWLHSFGRRVSEPGAIPEQWHGVAIDVTAIQEDPETRSDVKEEDRRSATDASSR
jgi:PAS domain S-box-containing protein